MSSPVSIQIEQNIIDCMYDSLVEATTPQVYWSEDQAAMRKQAEDIRLAKIKNVRSQLAEYSSRINTKG
jgi:hypothetical protein